MQPHNPSRSRLFGGILAGLFGWLTLGKAEAQASLHQPSPEPAIQDPQCGYISSGIYNANGDCIAQSGQLLCTGGVSYSYDGLRRMTPVIYHN
jgi:hypothetical protein